MLSAMDLQESGRLRLKSKRQEGFKTYNEMHCLVRETHSSGFKHQSVRFLIEIVLFEM